MLLHMAIRTLFFVILVIGLVGCGGSGGGGNSTPSPFEGTFSGSWTTTPTSEVGTSTFTIDASGDITGTTQNTTTSNTGTVTGHINANGTTTGTYTYTGMSGINYSGTLTLSNGGNTLSGPVVGAGVTTNLTLTRQ